MSDDESPLGEVDQLLEDIRGDWRRLGEAGSDREKRRIRKDMQARFEALRCKLENEPET